MKISPVTFTAALGLSALFGCLDPAADGNLVPRTVTEDSSLPQESWNGSTFHIEAFGDEGAPVIVMLHGGPGLDYRGLLRLREPVEGVRLEDNHQVIFWDQRGAGLSQRHDAEEITIEAYERDLDQLIDRHSPGAKVVLIGHSWGGMYAARYIQNHPEKVAGAVLLEPGPLTGKRFSDLKDEIFAIDLFSEWLNDFAWAGLALSAYDHAQADYMMLLGSLSDAQPTYHNGEKSREPGWRMGGVASAAILEDASRDGKPAWDFTKGLSSFPHKVQLQASSRNTTIGVEFQRMQMRDFANAELRIVEGVGHDFPWQAPEQTLRGIFDYLEEIEF